MPAHNTPHYRAPRSSQIAQSRDLAAWAVLILALSTRLRAAELETRALARQVHELTQVRDDLLDAADIHALCAHEERLIGLVRFYDRPARAAWS
ncbi:hypothetical protein [Nocardia sp. NBC_01327]|uniref:hypothetical protein n=1 Tax=Nocardia sp. NBC_01327 TaxID=2903593 RepID=UPI002E1132EF|nr:hypothetical protein OG326_21745 [Nocardia sp. NBC_01327]